MIRVRLFGTLRLDSGIRELSLEECEFCQLPRLTAAAMEKLSPGTKVNEETLKRCLVTVNGQPARRKTRLSSGDEICFFSPAAGG